MLSDELVTLSSNFRSLGNELISFSQTYRSTIVGDANFFEESRQYLKLGTIALKELSQ